MAERRKLRKYLDRANCRTLVDNGRLSVLHRALLCGGGRRKLFRKAYNLLGMFPGEGSSFLFKMQDCHVLLEEVSEERLGDSTQAGMRCFLERQRCGRAENPCGECRSAIGRAGVDSKIGSRGTCGR